MGNLNLTIENASDDNAIIAVFQTNPLVPSAISLVWFSQKINNLNTHKFTWAVDWSVNFDNSGMLQAGIDWTSTGQPVSLNPNTVGGSNLVPLSYNGDFELGIASNVPDEKLGSFQVVSDKTYTNTDAKKLSVSAYMNGTPALAIECPPDTDIQFSTHPTYYVARINSVIGSQISASAITGATKIIFEDGITDLSFTLNDTNTFIPTDVAVTA